MPQIDLSILNQRQTPAFYADVLANRPAAGFIGRIFVSTNTFEFYRDNGTGWDLIGGPGAGTITGSGTAGQVTYWNGASTVTGDNGLFYDAVNDRLGIGTFTPGAAIDAHSTQSTILQLNQTAINDTRIAFQLSGAVLWRIGNFYNGGANDFELFDVVGAQATFTVKKTSGQVLIGTSTVGSGKLVVASTTGDNGIQIVGATAPSLRIDSAASGPTKRVGLGISTATNNFIQGSADRDFCIFNGSTTAASPILFGVYDGGLTNVQEAARISAARRLLINTSVDAGFRLDVNGTARVQGVLTATADALINTIIVGRGGGAVATNTALGGTPLNLNTTGSNNIAIGNNALFYNTTGSFNTATGSEALFRNTGVTNTAFGSGALREQGAANSNTAIGQSAMYNNSTGSNNTALGRFAGNYISGGVTSNTNSNNSIFLGYETRALADNQTNQTVIGYQATGLGSNTTVLGNTSTTLTALYGAVITGGTSVNASAQLQADSTTKGFLPPRMTTAQKNAIGTPATGLVLYDTTLNKLCVYTGAAWETVTSV